MNLSVTLSKKSWHYWLQTWVLGSARPDLDSLCPYFWLTILCCILFLIVTPFKIFIWMFKIIDTYFLQPRLDNYLNNLAKEDFAVITHAWKSKKMWKKIPSTFTGRNKISFLYYIKQRWLELHGIHRYADRNDELRHKETSEYQKLMAELYEIFDELNVKEYEDARKVRHAREQKRLEAQARRQHIYNKIFGWWPDFTSKTFIIKSAMFTKRLLSAIFTIALGMGVVIGGKYLYVWLSMVNWLIILNVILLILLLVSALAIAVGLFIFIRNFILSLNLQKHSGPSKFNLFMEDLWFYISKFLIGLWIVVSWPFKFFIQYFIATKNNYCPHINWK